MRSFTQGLAIAILGLLASVLLVHAQTPSRNCTDLTGQINKAATLAQALRGLARIEVVRGNDDEAKLLSQSASTLGGLAAQAIITSPCFKGASQ